MKRYIIELTKDGEMKLPPSILKAIHGDRKIRISRIENHFELEFPNGAPILTQPETVIQ